MTLFKDGKADYFYSGQLQQVYGPLQWNFTVGGQRLCSTPNTAWASRNLEARSKSVGGKLLRGNIRDKGYSGKPT